MTNQTQHTPGPWKVSCDGRIRSKKIINVGSQDYICEMPFTTPREADEMPESDANARLIAAAPEMLEVLQYIAGHASACLIANEYGKQEGLKDCINAALKAIAKAKGRE